MRSCGIAKQIRIQKKQNKNHMVGSAFNTLGKNERRKSPWLGSAWFEDGMEEKRAEYIRAWQEETERMLKENPNLKIVQ